MSIRPQACCAVWIRFDSKQPFLSHAVDVWSGRFVATVNNYGLMTMLFMTSHSYSDENETKYKQLR